jgi:hypothetical protein
MAKDKYISRATSMPTAEIINRATGDGPIMADQKEPLKHDHKIVFHPPRQGVKGVKVDNILVRFGMLDRKGNPNWVKTIAVEGSVKMKPGQPITVATVDNDQLPAKPHLCYYTLLCDLFNKKDGHSETLIIPATRVMPPPTRVRSAGKL